MGLGDRRSSVASLDTGCALCKGKMGELDYTVLCCLCASPAHASCADITNPMFEKFEKSGALPFISVVCNRRHLETKLPTATTGSHSPNSVPAPAPVPTPAMDPVSIVNQVIQVLTPAIEKLVRNIAAPTGTSNSTVSITVPEPLPPRSSISATTLSVSPPGPTAPFTNVTNKSALQWTDVVRKRTRKVTTAGNAPDGIIKGIVIPETVPKAVFHVKNLKACTTKEHVITHLADNGISGTNVSFFRAKDHPEVVNARIAVYKAHALKMHNDAIWPNGVIVNNWKNKPKRATPAVNEPPDNTQEANPPSASGTGSQPAPVTN